MQNWNYAELGFLFVIMSTLLRIVWYAKELVDDVHKIAYTQQEQQATLDKHDAAIHAHNMELAILKDAHKR
jgi:hypothetical protein